VRFLGFQNQTELSRYYHAAELVVLPSAHSETWGLVVNEALHHGVPCVVSEAVGCAPDLVEPGVTGEVCETGSTPSLTAGLLRAIAMVNRGDVRDACRARVADYSVERAARGIAEAYDAMAYTGQRAPAGE
jgi:glycosyltransferase involved in cell wall biosynthesis